MLFIDGNNIKLTRGDTAYIEVPINVETDEGSAPYILDPDDTLTLSVKKKIKDEETLLQKVVKGSSTIHFMPDDTKEMDFGTYIYDIQLTTSSGDIYTVIGPTESETPSFRVLGEVTV